MSRACRTSSAERIMATCLGSASEDPWRPPGRDPHPRAGPAGFPASPRRGSIQGRWAWTPQDLDRSRSRRADLERFRGRQAGGGRPGEPGSARSSESSSSDTTTAPTAAVGACRDQAGGRPPQRDDAVNGPGSPSLGVVLTGWTRLSVSARRKVLRQPMGQQPSPCVVAEVPVLGEDPAVAEGDARQARTRQGIDPTPRPCSPKPWHRSQRLGEAVQRSLSHWLSRCPWNALWPPRRRTA